MTFSNFNIKCILTAINFIAFGCTIISAFFLAGMLNNGKTVQIYTVASDCNIRPYSAVYNDFIDTIEQGEKRKK